MPKEKLNPYHYDELSDRALVIKFMILQFINSHPTVTQDKLLREATGIAIKQLEKIGKLGIKLGNKDQNMLYDRAEILCETVSDLLLDDKRINTDKAALKYAQAAMDNLWKLYQHLSKKFFDEL